MAVEHVSELPKLDVTKIVPQLELLYILERLNKIKRDVEELQNIIWDLAK